MGESPASQQAAAHLTAAVEQQVVIQKRLLPVTKSTWRRGTDPGGGIPIISAGRQECKSFDGPRKAAPDRDGPGRTGVAGQNLTGGGNCAKIAPFITAETAGSDGFPQGMPTAR